MSRTLTLYRTAERPDAQLWIVDDDGTLINFSTGYSFSFKLGSPGEAATFTKTSGITGAAGSGSEPDGTPNVTFTFTDEELDDLTAGPTTGQLTATTSGLDRVFQFPVVVKDVIA